VFNAAATSDTDGIERMTTGQQVHAALQNALGAIDASLSVHPFPDGNPRHRDRSDDAGAGFG